MAAPIDLLDCIVASPSQSPYAWDILYCLHMLLLWTAGCILQTVEVMGYKDTQQSISEAGAVPVLGTIDTQAMGMQHCVLLLCCLMS